VEASTGSTETQEPRAAESRNGGRKNVGRVEEVAGVVIEAVFPDQLPEIYNALEIDLNVEGEDRKLICEVQQHLADQLPALALHVEVDLERVVDLGKLVREDRLDHDARDLFDAAYVALATV